MANGADGSIVIDSQLDNSGFQRGSKELDSAIKGLKTEVLSIGDDMKNAVQTMQSALQDMGSAAQENGDKFRAAMDQEDMDKAMTVIQGHVQSLLKDLSKIGQAEAQGVKPGSQLVGLENQIQKTEQQLNVLKDRLFEFGNAPVGDSKEMEELQKQWDALDEEIRQVKKSIDEQRALGLPESFIHESDLKRAKELEEKLDAIGLKMADLEDSGQGTVWNADSEEFKALEENYHKMTEALQVYRQALQEAKNDRVAKTQELEQERAEAIQLEAQTRAAALAEKEAAAQEKAQASAARESAQSVSGLSRVLSAISSTASHAAASLGRLVLQGVTVGIKAAARAMTELGSALLRAGTAATRAMAGIGKLSLKTVALGARAAAKGVWALVQRLRSLGTHGSKATLTSNGLVKALTGFKRMLISRVKRTFIGTVFKDLQSGLHSFAKYSATFNAAMSSMKNSMTALSGNIGVLAGNLITALAPALNTIIDWLSRAISYVNAFFALLSGKKTYTVAQKGTADYAASLDKSGKSAKNAQGAVQDLKKEVYGFDELNKASGSGSGGSGGSGNSGTDAAEDEIQFMEKTLASLPDGISKFMDSLKQAFSAKEFRYVGALLSDGLDVIVERVNAFILKLRPKAVQWTKNITEILNGLIDNFDWEALGTMLGNGFNLILDVAEAFVDTLEFDTLTLSITDALNMLTETIDWPKLGSTLYKGIKGLYKVIVATVALYDWQSLGKGIGDAINSVTENDDWDKAIETAKAAGQGIADGINTLADTIEWEDLGYSIANGFNVITNGINTFLEELNIDEITTDLATGFNGILDGIDWETLGKTVGNGLDTLIQAFTGFPAQIEWGTLAQGIGTSLNNLVSEIDWTTATENAKTAGKGFADGINTLADTIDWSAIGDSISSGFNLIVEATQSFLEELNIDEVTTGLATGLNSLLDGVNWDTLGTTLGDGMDALLQTITGFPAKIFGREGEDNLGTKIATAMNSAFSSIDWATIGKNLSDSAKGLLTDITTAISTLDWAQIGRDVQAFLEAIDWNGVIDGMMKAIGAAMTGFTKLLWGLFEKPLENVKARWKLYFTLAGGNAIGALKLAITNALSSIGTWVHDHIIKPLLAGMDSALGLEEGTIENIASSVWESLKTSFETAWNTVKDAFGTVFSAAWEHIKSFFKLDELGALAKNIWMGLKNGLSSAWSRFKDRLLAPFRSLWSAVKKFFGIASPSTKAEEMGGYILEGLVKGIEGAIDGAVTQITALFGRIWDGITSVFSGVSTFFSNVLDDVLIGLGIVDPAAREAYKQASSLRDTYNKAVSDVFADGLDPASFNDYNKALAAAVFGVGVGGMGRNDFTQAAQEWLDKNAGLGDVWADTISMFWDRMMTAGAVSGEEMTGDWVKEYMSQNMSDVFDFDPADVFDDNFFETVAQWLRNGGLDSQNTVMDSVVTALIGNVETDTNAQIEEAIQGVTEDTVGTATQAGTDIGGNIADGMATGIEKNTSNVKIAAQNAAIEAYNAACDTLGIASPSRVFSKIGDFIMQGWAEGMEGNQSLITETIGNAAQAASAEASNADALFGDGVFVTGLDAVAEKLHEILDMFMAMSSTINGMGGLPMPAIATGEYVPYRVRYTDDMAAVPGYGATDTFTRNFDETMSDQRDVLREILTAIRNLDLRVDGRTLERSLSNLSRDRIRAYGGG